MQHNKVTNNRLQQRLIPTLSQKHKGANSYRFRQKKPDKQKYRFYLQTYKVEDLNDLDKRNLYLSLDKNIKLPEKLPSVPQDEGLVSTLKFFSQITLYDAGLRWRILSCLFLVFISKALGIMQHIFFKNAIDTISNQTQRNVNLAFMFALGVGGSKILSSVLRESLSPIFSVVTQIASRRIAYNTFDHVLNLDYAYHLNRHTGRLMKVLDRGNWSIRILFRTFFFILIPTLIEFFFVIGLLGRQFNPYISLCVMVTFVTYITFTLKQTQKLTKQRQKVNDIENHVQSQANDVLLNYETMALFNNQGYESSRYHQGLFKYQKASLKYEMQMAFLNAGQSTLLWSGLSACLSLSILMVSSGSLKPGDLVLIYGLITQLWVPLEYLGWLYREVKQALVDMKDFFGVLRTQSKIQDGTQDLVIHRHSSNGQIQEGSQQGLEIQFNNVEFEYAQEHRKKDEDEQNVKISDHRILKGVNLTIKPGQSVAIVGPSGSGKSTIIKLLTRLFDVTKGEILLEGQNIKDLKMQSLRNYMAAVPQDTILYNDSIANNIRYGNTEATLDQVIEVAKYAQLHDDIMGMPDQYDTMAGERGLKLSGGQRQRMAIARAFLKKPNLIICDEATSALDTTTEQKIIKSLNTLAAGRTAVFVAHRLSTIKDCDVICVIDNGVIQEKGGHQELINRNGLYSKMWEKQASTNTEDVKSIDKALLKTLQKHRSLLDQEDLSIEALTKKLVRQKSSIEEEEQQNKEVEYVATQSN